MRNITLAVEFSFIRMKKCLLPILACGAAFVAFGTLGPSDNEEESSQSAELPQAIHDTLAGIGKPKAIRSTNLDGFYEVEMSGGSLIYISEDGKYLFIGELYKREDDGFRNLTDERKRAMRVQLLAALDPEETINFGTGSSDASVVHVFTDVDCGYCRVMHRNMSEYNDKGIEIRYLAYPRSGPDTQSFYKIASAWCSEDPKSAITALKNGQDIPITNCESPVAEHYALGQTIGITGTPALLLPDGSLVPGAVPADELARIINH